MLNFDDLDLIAEASLGLKKVAVYRCHEGRYFVHNTMDVTFQEIHPAEAVAWYNKVNLALDWAIKIPAMGEEER